MEKMTNLTTGLWKFHESVPLEVLQEVAEEWAKDERYKYLYIRWASKDQRAIGFTYEKEDGAKGTHEKFFEENRLDRLDDYRLFLVIPPTEHLCQEKNMATSCYFLQYLAWRGLFLPRRAR